MVDNVWNGLHIVDLRATSRRLHLGDQGAPMRHDTAGGGQEAITRSQAVSRYQHFTSRNISQGSTRL